VTTFKGYDVFDVMPNRREDPDESWMRGATRLGALPGMMAVHDPIGRTAKSRTVSWFLRDTDEIADAEAFLAAREGRRVPFWLPTWHRDLTLASAASSGAATLSVTDVGYTANLYPLAHRKHLALIRSALSLECVAVTSAVDAGATETLGVSPVLGADLATSAMLSFLLFVRLADDAQTIRYHARGLAELVFDVVELPREVPA
jgi:hypothetical protein